ncbi:MAG: hypothetical protein FJX36_04465 [Alphaproteobacteria bacterium]|nr:hypothetical protein [Alphaproteobacteria bacterium]
MRDVRRRTRKPYSAEEKIQIVLSGLRGEASIAELCRREGIAESLGLVQQIRPHGETVRAPVAGHDEMNGEIIVNHAGVRTVSRTIRAVTRLAIRDDSLFGL